MRLKTVDSLVILLYLAGMLLIGLYFARRRNSEENYFVGGRRVPSFLAGISILATLLSTISYLSIPGEMIRYGIGFFSSYLGFILIIPVLNKLVIPYLMRLPVTSIYEYLEKRYGVEVRTMAAAVFVLTRLIWIGLIIYTASIAVTAMTGWSMSTVILMTGLITTFYTTSGGLPAVIWSDCVQFVVMFGGSLGIPVYIAFRTATGPSTWWNLFSQAGHTSIAVFSLDPTVRTTLVGMIAVLFVWNICTHGADQVATQRYLSTPSVSSARRSVWVFAVSNLALVAILMLSGMALFFFYYSARSPLSLAEFQSSIAPRADRLLPEFIVGELPPGLAGLLMAALMAAAMSSLSSGINSISTVIITDFVQRFAILRKRREGVGLAMAVAGMAGLVGIASALAVDKVMESSAWNLLELMERANHLFVGPLGALFFSGLLFRRVGGRAAVAGFIMGALTSVVISFSKPIFGMDRGISFMWIMPASLAVSLTVSFSLGFVCPRPTQSQLGGLVRERLCRHSGNDGWTQ